MLTNRSRKQTIAAKARFARTFWQRFRGLMFFRRKDFDFALVFELPQETRIGAGIHMLFVFFAIDVVFLDSRKKVVDVVRNLKPFAPGYAPKKAAKYIIELPAGAAKNIRVGDEIGWQD